jgi:hypothetical protein
MTQLARIITLFEGLLFSQRSIAVPDVSDAIIFNKRDVVAGLGPLLSPGATIYTSSSPDWANVSSRWSVYSEPTWDYVVVPETEKDIATTVRDESQVNVISNVVIQNGDINT